MFYYGIDITYIIYVLPALILTLIAQFWVKSAYAKASKIRVLSGKTGAEVAQRVLYAAGVTGVSIAPIGGEMTDNFNPRNNTISLSQGVHSTASVAAAGIAAHECGHAIQYAKGYGALKLRNAIIPVCNIGSTAAMPLVLLGFLFNFQALVTLGIIFFGAAVLFQLITLPVEFNASRRAIKLLESTGTLSESELPQVKRVLTAAAMTYVAALAVSVMQLVRLIALFGRRSRD